MSNRRRKKPSYYTEEDHRLLQILFTKYGNGNRNKRAQYWEKVCNEFNSVTKSAKRNSIQIRAYFNNRKRDSETYPFKSENNDSDHEIVLQRSPLILPPPADDLEEPNDELFLSQHGLHESPEDDKEESLGSPVKKPKISSTTSSSSGYLGSSSEQNDDFRSLSDDLPKSWEYTEIGTSFLTSNDQSSSTLNSDREEPHIFDDIDNFSIGRTSNIDKSGMSSDLVNILSEQARQHHKLKMKLLKEKFRKLSETHKTKMYMMEKELEMKRKEHERKMDILMQKYKSIKNGLEE